MLDARGPGGVALSPSELEKLRALIERHGESEMARRFCVHRATVLRAAFGRPVHRSTARLLQLCLERLETTA
jgi:hypothetical protein